MRIKLSEQYAEEREQICKKLIDILELDEQGSFLLSELDENIQKQQVIMDMKEEIQKCFAVSKVTSYRKDVDCKRPYLNLERAILRAQGYTFISTICEVRINDFFKKTQRYFVFRNN